MPPGKESATTGLNYRYIAMAVAIGVASSTATAVSLVVGAAVGIACAGVFLVICRKKPSRVEVLQGAVALAAILVIAAAVGHWSDFKDGIAAGFLRAWPF